MYGTGEWRRVNGSPFWCSGGACTDCIFYFDGSTCESEEHYLARTESARLKERENEVEDA